MKNRWADNHNNMELLTKAISESATGAAAAVYILQEVKKSKRKQGCAEAEWAKTRKKVVGKKALQTMLQMAVGGQQGLQQGGVPQYGCVQQQ